MKYRQTIQIANNVSDILKLPCVSYVSKCAPDCTDYIYWLYPSAMRDDSGDMTHRHVARRGYWLCEDYDGKWTVTKKQPQNN